jgi:GAF domain-containing protein
MNKRSALVALLRQRQQEIAAAWAQEVHRLPGTRYNELAPGEIHASALHGVSALIEDLTAGSQRATDAYLRDMAARRQQTGFDISEVIEALLLFEPAVLPVIWSEGDGGSQEGLEMLVHLGARLRSMAGRLGQLYAEVMHQSLRAQQERTALILDAAEAASSTLRLDQVLERIVAKSTETFKLGCALYVWDPRRATLVPEVRSGVLDDECPTTFSQIELPAAANALLHDILEHKIPIVCYGADAHGGHEIAQALGLESMMIVPIVCDGQVFVVVIGSPGQGCHRFTQEDIKLAQEMSNTVGLAIRNAQLYEKTRQRLAELRSLQRMTAALLKKLTLKQVLEIVCQEARELTGTTGCALYSLQDQAWLQLAHSGGVLEPPANRMPLEGTLAGRAVLSGEPLLINDLDELAQTSHPIPDLESLLVIPLRLGDSVVGALDVTNKPGGFTQDDVRILSLFADGATLAIESAQLHQQAEQLAVVEERQRLARELHDSVSQALYSVTLYAEATRMAISAGKQEVAAKNLEEVHRMAREAMMDMRMLIFELHPPVLEEEGLGTALQARLAAVEARAGLQAEILVQGERRLPLPLEEDDGVGFDPAKAGQGGGMGLQGMEERVQRIGGRLKITSAPGQGATVTVETEI